MQANNIYKVKIEKIVANGYGLAFAESLTFFVSLAAVGDEVLVKVNQRKGKIVFAEIVEIIEPSTLRIEPKCKYFGRCGGCDFQHLNYSAQLETKKQILLDCLKRIGKLNHPPEQISVHSSPKEFNYRTRSRFHLDSRKKKLGFFRRNSHEVFDVESCPVLDENLESEFIKIRQSVNFEEIWSEVLEIETSLGENGVSVFADEFLSETKEISQTFGKFRYFFNSKTFFQGNISLIPALLQTALGAFEGQTALDLYCGIGLFSLPLSEKFEKVIGVEANPTSIEFAVKNAEFAGKENIEFVAQETAEFLRENRDLRPDLILLDPPRSGTESQTIELILDLKPQHLVYVACDPATLARDLKTFCHNTYIIESIDIIDLFPQTHHLETVVKLKLAR